MDTYKISLKFYCGFVWKGLKEQDSQSVLFRHVRYLCLQKVFTLHLEEVVSYDAMAKYLLKSVCIISICQQVNWQNNIWNSQMSHHWVFRNHINMYWFEIQLQIVQGSWEAVMDAEKIAKTRYSVPSLHIFRHNTSVSILVISILSEVLAQKLSFINNCHIQDSLEITLIVVSTSNSFSVRNL